MRFVADRMLGKLAKGLRLLGYDTVYYQGEDLYHLIQWARAEGRVILTRNRKLVAKRPEDRLVRIMGDHPTLQLQELIQKGYVTRDEEEHFSRCLLCNALLDAIPRGEAEGRVPDFVFHERKEFFRCPQCRRIYWQGSHQKNMQAWVEGLFQA